MSSSTLAKYQLRGLFKTVKGNKSRPLSNPRAKLTNDQKRKISEQRIKYLELHPDKVPYLLCHSSRESNPEKTLRLRLTDLGIEGWIQEFRVGRYSYDFAFPSLKIDVEIDGSFHEKEHVKLIDQKRDEYSRSLGWTVIRIPAKIIRVNVDDAINIIKMEIDKINYGKQAVVS